FVLCCLKHHSSDCFSKEIYDAALGRWSLLPRMIEERFGCAAVNIPDTGVLFIGGLGRNGFILRSTELLTRRSGKGGEKWQWRHFPPMNYGHRGFPLSVYFQGRVYVVGYVEFVKKMEMLDVETGGQWTFLNFFRQPLKVFSMARVGNELFIAVSNSPALYSIKLDSDPKRRLAKWRKRKFTTFVNLMM
ncbi:unnamed protein product, partial [Hymenolepis diminuta]